MVAGGDAMLKRRQGMGAREIEDIIVWTEDLAEKKLQRKFYGDDCRL